MASRAALNEFTETVYDAMQAAELDSAGALAALLALACCVNLRRREPLTPVALGALLTNTASKLPLTAARVPFAEA